jgi:hypothetical protein
MTDKHELYAKHENLLPDNEEIEYLKFLIDKRWLFVEKYVPDLIIKNIIQKSNTLDERFSIKFADITKIYVDGNEYDVVFFENHWQVLEIYIENKEYLQDRDKKFEYPIFIEDTKCSTWNDLAKVWKIVTDTDIETFEKYHEKGGISLMTREIYHNHVIDLMECDDTDYNYDEFEGDEYDKQYEFGILQFITNDKKNNGLKTININGVLYYYYRN